MITITSCPVCGSSAFQPLISCIDHTVSHETFQIVKCKNCEFALTSPRPDNEKLGDYYRSDNYISHSNKATGLIDKLYLLARKFTLRWKVSLVQKHALTKNTFQLLDYGCGTGEFLKSCLDAGFKIAGIEPSSDARRKSSQITQTKINESINDLENQKFNIITLWHVLEHIPDFENILQQLKARLTDDGIILIAVPNHKSFDAKLYSEHWAGFDVPRHLWHFSADTINKVLTKNKLLLTGTYGMKLDSYYVSVLSEKYKSGNKATLTGYVKAVINGMRSNWKANTTGDYSSLIYIAKK